MSLFKRLLEKAAGLAPCVEWLAELWALIRGLLILLLVGYSIISSIQISGHDTAGFNLLLELLSSK